MEKDLVLLVYSCPRTCGVIKFQAKFISFYVFLVFAVLHSPIKFCSTLGVLLFSVRCVHTRTQHIRFRFFLVLFRLILKLHCCGFRDVCTRSLFIFPRRLSRCCDMVVVDDVSYSHFPVCENVRLVTVSCSMLHACAKMCTMQSK